MRRGTRNERRKNDIAAELAQALATLNGALAQSRTGFWRGGCQQDPCLLVVALVYPRNLDDIGQGCRSGIVMMVLYGRGDSIVDSKTHSPCASIFKQLLFLIARITPLFHTSVTIAKQSFPGSFKKERETV